jgi:hypothetical protein
MLAAKMYIEHSNIAYMSMPFAQFDKGSVDG